MKFIWITRLIKKEEFCNCEKDFWVSNLFKMMICKYSMNAKISQATTSMPSKFQYDSIESNKNTHCLKHAWQSFFIQIWYFLFSVLLKRTKYLYPGPSDDNHNPSFKNECRGRQERKIWRGIFVVENPFLKDDLLAFYFFGEVSFRLKSFILCSRFGLSDFGFAALPNLS